MEKPNETTHEATNEEKLRTQAKERYDKLDQDFLIFITCLYSRYGCTGKINDWIINRMQDHQDLFTLTKYATFGEMHRLDFRHNICAKYIDFFRKCLRDIVPYMGNDDLFNRRTHKPVNANEIGTQFVPIEREIEETRPTLYDLIETVDAQSRTATSIENNTEQ